MEEKRMLCILRSIITIWIVFFIGLLSTVFAQENSFNEKDYIDKKQMEDISKMVASLKNRVSKVCIDPSLIKGTSNPEIKAQLNRFIKRNNLEIAGENTKHNLTGEKLYLLISSSMPRETILSYVHDMDRFSDQEIILVLRGLIDNDMMKTLNYIKALKSTDLNCEEKCTFYQAQVHIDPTKFEKFGIESVPAFVLTDHKNNPKIIIKGDIPLRYMAKKAQKKIKSVLLETLTKSENYEQ
jgi:type-F conjugative transfer system pilin assembly protein TrbC